MKHIKLFTDGASKGNPGEAGIGICICDTQNNIIKEISKYIGRQTNNYAEYYALIEGLNACLKFKMMNVEAFLDSELVVKQLSGEYKVRNKNIKPLYEKVVKLKSKFKTISFKHINRSLNKEADRLANEALTR